MEGLRAATVYDQSNSRESIFESKRMRAETQLTKAWQYALKPNLLNNYLTQYKTNK